MEYNAGTALAYVMARREYLHLPKEQEQYILARIHAAANRLKDNGIDLEDTPQDLMLLVDMTVWEMSNRDKPGAMPEWLAQARRERWLHGNKKAGDAGAP